MLSGVPSHRISVSSPLSFVFFLSINKYKLYIFNRPLLSQSRKAVQVLIEMERCLELAPAGSVGDIQEMNAAEVLTAPSHVFYGAMSPSLLEEQNGSPSVLEGARVQAISQLKATSGSSSVFWREAAGEGSRASGTAWCKLRLVSAPCVRQLL